MQAFKVGLVLLSLVFLCGVQQTLGHGWMISPKPRSGGSGSGTASTSAACGTNAGVLTVVANFTVGSTIPVTYKAVNGHGGPCNCVDLTFSKTAYKANPTANDFTGTNVIVAATNLPIDPNAGTTITKTITAPNTTGVWVLQWKWRAAGGGSWYDCANLNIISPPGPNPCDLNNGGCSANALCVPDSSNKPVCTCKTGFIGSGITCNALPEDVEVKLTFAVPNPDDGFQNTVTAKLETLLNAAGRITYNTGVNDTRTTVVTFDISADPTTGQSGQAIAEALRQMVSSNSTTLQNFGYEVYSVQISNVDPNPVLVGAPIVTVQTSSSSSGTGGADGVIAGAVISFLVLAALLVYAQYLKRTKYSTLNMKMAQFASSSSANIQGTSSPRKPHQQLHQQPAHTVNVDTDAENEVLPPGWTKHLNDQGIPYYFNEATQDSQWTKP